MSLAELVPEIHALAHGDKVRLAHLLITELARDEGVPLGDMETAYPATESRIPRWRGKIQEHDLVTVEENVETEGYSIKKGMTGTVVSVYRDGEGYAVEFSELPDGPAVVTLFPAQVRPEGQ
ncbi:MAG: DUF4926 domain-containing protein [Planctomycetota bacterium]